MSSILIFLNILTYVMQHFCIINTQNFKTASTGSGKWGQESWFWGERRTPRVSPSLTRSHIFSPLGQWRSTVGREKSFDKQQHQAEKPKVWVFFAKEEKRKKSRKLEKEQPSDQRGRFHWISNFRKRHTTWIAGLANDEFGLFDIWIKIWTLFQSF